MRILVVDDDAVVRRTLEALLTTRGWEVICATDGEQAYALLQAHDAPQLAIIDWMMPGMSGPELCRKLRASDKTSHMHLIMLTGRAGTDDMIVGLDSGADDFVGKPVNIEELDARIRAAQRLILRQEQVRTQATIDELTATKPGSHPRWVAAGVEPSGAGEEFMLDRPLRRGSIQVRQRHIRPPCR